MKRFIDIISKERAAAYKVNQSDSDEDVLACYLYNIELGKAFYPLLDFIEISLRNRINNVFIEDFGKGWLTEGNLLDENMQQSINELMIKLKQKHKDVTNYRLVSELNFGFWSNLFNKPYHVLWQQNKRLKRVFINHTTNLKEVSGELNVLRKFRNRVFHFETLYNHNPEYCHELLLKYIAALTNAEFMEIVHQKDKVKELIK